MKMQSPTPPDDALIRLDEVLKRIPVSRSTYYAGQAKGLYPKSVWAGPRSRAYRYADVKAWLEDPLAWSQRNSRSG